MKFYLVLIISVLSFNFNNVFATSEDDNTKTASTKTVNGKAFIDNNVDQTFDVNDLGIEGITIEAFEDVNSNGHLDDGDKKVKTTITDNNGVFEMSLSPTFSNTLSYKINASTDDAVQNEPGGVMILNSESVSGIREIGLRFTDINIPQGAKINSASLKITMANDAEDFIEIIVSGEATDNPTTFINEDYNIYNRPRTTTTLSWFSSVAREDSMEIELDNIQAVIQEIVDRPGWNAGNALALIIADFNCDMYMFDGGFPAELIINYTNESTSEVGYILAPVLNNIDPSLELVSEVFQYVTITEESVDFENINFVFNAEATEVITSNEENIIEIEDVSLNIFPTITNGPVNLSLSGVEYAQNFSLQVFSTDGKLQSQESFEASGSIQNQYDLSSLSKGTYMIKVSNENKSFVEKVIVF